MLHDQIKGCKVDIEKLFIAPKNDMLKESR